MLPANIFQGVMCVRIIRVVFARNIALPYLLCHTARCITLPYRTPAIQAEIESLQCNTPKSEMMVQIELIFNSSAYNSQSCPGRGRNGGKTQLQCVIKAQAAQQSKNSAMFDICKKYTFAKRTLKHQRFCSGAVTSIPALFISYKMHINYIYWLIFSLCHTRGISP